jgi:hypothetical protein
VPTWASALAHQLHLDALTRYLTVWTLNMNHLSPMNQNSHLNTSWHVHAHISDRWKNEGVCMRLLRCIRYNFLELDTSFNDEMI